jgi:hypothetical protein
VFTWAVLALPVSTAATRERSDVWSATYVISLNVVNAVDSPFTLDTDCKAPAWSYEELASR